jgi:hypothetical protein
MHKDYSMPAQLVEIKTRRGCATRAFHNPKIARNQFVKDSGLRGLFRRHHLMASLTDRTSECYQGALYRSITPIHRELYTQLVRPDMCLQRILDQSYLSFSSFSVSLLPSTLNRQHLLFCPLAPTLSPYLRSPTS